MQFFDLNWYRRTIINSLPAQVVIAGFLLTLAVSVYVYYSGYEKEQLQFENEVENVEQSISETLMTYLALLNAARGYVYTHEYIDRENFSQFVSELRLREAYPGLQGIGYITTVEQSQKAAVEARQRAQGFDDFTIHPATSSGRYYPILYLEPLDQRNDIALGFDMSSQQVRRVAMEQARDSGDAVLSGKVSLVQGSPPDQQPGFLFLLPFYTQNRTPLNSQERRDSLEGYVYAPLRAGDFFAAVFENARTPRVNLTVYDGDSESAAAMLYQYNPDVDYTPRFTLHKTLNQGDHQWTLVFTSKASLDISSERSLVPFFVLSGLGITAILFFVSRSLVQARLQAEAFQVDLMKSQVALQNSEERLRLIVESLKDLAIITLDVSGAVTSWNPGADRFFGYSERQIIGKHYGVFFTPRERRSNKPVRDLSHVLETGSIEFERMMIRKNGTRFWASGLMSALYDADERLRGIVMIVQDVSNRKRSEAQLRKQESVTQAVMSSLPDLIAVLDRTGTIVSANTSWNTFMAQLPPTRGSSVNTIGDNYIRQLEKNGKRISGEYAQQVAAGIRRLLHGEITEFVFEYPVQLHNEELWFLLTATALKHEEGGVVVSHTNITTLKKIDQQKNEFLSIVSHELKTPITSTRAYVQVLQKLLTNAGDLREASIITKVLNQIDKMQLLIADLLDISKIEAGKLRLDKQEFAIDELVFEIAEAMQLTSETHAIRFKGTSGAIINADRERIGQVIINLMDNAIKYSPDAETIEVESFIQENQVVVAVRDFGLGISKKDQKRLFQRFFRVQQASKGVVYPGLGLGLYICAEIIERSGGTLTVESELGKGSVFSVILPTVRVHTVKKQRRTK